MNANVSFIVQNVIELPLSWTVAYLFNDSVYPLSPGNRKIVGLLHLKLRNKTTLQVPLNVKLNMFDI
jgi:hypothetical protein